MEVDIDNDEDDLDIVYTWRTTKLPLSAIAQNNRHPTAKVLKVIKYTRAWYDSKWNLTPGELQNQEER